MVKIIDNTKKKLYNIEISAAYYWINLISISFQLLFPIQKGSHHTFSE